MSPWPSLNTGQSNTWSDSAVSNPAVVRFFNSVYAWMCVGLLITGAVAWFTSQNPSLLMSMGAGVWLLFIVEIVLVMTIAGAINRIGATAATALFILYAALNGLTLSVIFLVYAQSTIASAFVISAATFGVLSIYGLVTQTDLTRLGSILFMALIGLVIASIVSLFWHNSALQVLINYAGVLIFVGLTAYDTQRLKMIASQTQDNPALANRLAVVGSLMLYLDFINLFLFILRILGSRRR